MDSLGDLLKDAREERGLSIEQVSRDTNISKAFLKAIEKEDFSNFPGETYVVGFIRNYAEYLGFKGDDYVQMYRNLMIQGQPLPLEELINGSHKISKKVLYILFGAFGGVVIIALLVLFLTGVFGQRPQKKVPVIVSTKHDGKTLEFNGSREIFDIALKDRVNMTETISGKDYSIFVESVDAVQSKIRFKISGGDGTLLPLVEVDAGDSKIVDLNQDGTRDVKITLNVVKSNGVASVEFNRAFLAGSNFLLKDSLLGGNFLNDNRFSNNAPAIISAKTPVPFDVVFTGENSNTIKYRIDGGDLIEMVGLPTSGNTRQLSLKAKNGVVVWVTNKNGIEMRINNQKVDFPLQVGPATSFFISWKSNNANGYDLGLYSLDAPSSN